MKIWLFAVVLAFAVAAASAAAVSEVAAVKYLAKDKTDVDVAVTDVPEADAEAKVETEGEEESETEGKEGEKEEGGSNESSSEENEEEEKEEEESSTNHQADEEVTTVKVLDYVPVVGHSTTETYIKPAYVPTAATYSKSNYIQIPGPVYKPAITTEPPKPTVTYNVVKTETSTPAVVETVETPNTESKYVVKPVVAAVVETTTKYSPIVFEKPSSAPVVTVRKSGWVRAPGYNLGYARSENSDPAVVETPRTSATRSEPLATAKTAVTPLAYRQWFYKPQ